MMQNRSIRAGITGGMGSGKSTFSKILRDENYRVIDADEISREVFKRDEVQNYLRNKYKDRIITDGSLDRKKIASIIFNSPSDLKEYEAVIIPLIISEIEREFEKHKTEKIIFLDAPLLLEKAENLIDLVITVETDEEIMIKRAMERDGISREKVLERLKNQMTEDERVKKSDYVIRNNGTKEDLRKLARNLVSDIKRRQDGI